MYKTLLGAGLLLVTSVVGAQQTTLQQCAEIEDSLERLVCYDNLAKRQNDQPEKSQGKAKGKEIAKKEREPVSVQAREKGSLKQSFGMEHKEKKEDKIDRIEVKVAAKEQGPYNKWRIVLANGQVWKQTGGASYFSWDDDDTYYIERGALDSFFFGREGSNRRMRVQRVK